MKTVSFLVLVLILCFAVIPISGVGMAKADMLTCNEAIGAVDLGNWNTQSFSFKRTDGFEEAVHECENGILSILVWLAPNGTYYQIEYQSERVIRKIGESYSSEWNPPDGYTFWYLIYEDGEIYWVDAFDGSIIFHLSSRGSPPQFSKDISPEPTPESNLTPQESEPESFELNSAESTGTSLVFTTEIVIAATVSIASIIAIASYWIIKRK